MNEDQYGRIYNKLEKLDESVAEINITLAKQHVSLEEHIRRTKLNEEALVLFRNEMKPVQKHVDYVTGALKLVGILALLAGIYKAFATGT